MYFRIGKNCAYWFCSLPELTVISPFKPGCHVIENIVFEKKARKRICTLKLSLHCDDDDVIFAENCLNLDLSVDTTYLLEGYYRLLLKSGGSFAHELNDLVWQPHGKTIGFHICVNHGETGFA